MLVFTQQLNDYMHIYFSDKWVYIMMQYIHLTFLILMTTAKITYTQSHTKAEQTYPLTY